MAIGPGSVDARTDVSEVMSFAGVPVAMSELGETTVQPGALARSTGASRSNPPLPDLLPAEPDIISELS